MPCVRLASTSTTCRARIHFDDLPGAHPLRRPAGRAASVKLRFMLVSSAGGCRAFFSIVCQMPCTGLTDCDQRTLPGHKPVYRANGNINRLACALHADLNLLSINPHYQPPPSIDHGRAKARPLRRKMRVEAELVFT